jgi:hypothetical protein
MLCSSQDIIICMRGSAPQPRFIIHIRCVIETPPAEVGFWQPSPQRAGLTADRSHNQ